MWIQKIFWKENFWCQFNRTLFPKIMPKYFGLSSFWCKEIFMIWPKIINICTLLQYNNLSIFFRIPEASSLMLNIILSDTIFNVFRDHNFDSCTICVCSNEGNIRGRDAAPYLPNFQGDDDCVCCCGFSALSNRKLAHQSGLFYEVRKIRIYSKLSKKWS